jgi:hypothetical protein
MMSMDAMVEAAAKTARSEWYGIKSDWDAIPEDARDVWRRLARSTLLAALAAVPVGEEVERVAGWLDDEYSHAAAAGASLLRSLSASLAAVTADRDRLRAATEAFGTNLRDAWEALSAMRDQINEAIPMPSSEADLLTGPEISVSCAAIAEAVCTRVAAVTAERNEALHQVEELERNAEKVADEFERDCWKALRSLLAECHFEWDADARLEGVSAEEAREHISTTLAECDRAAERFKAERDEAIRQRDQAVEERDRLKRRTSSVLGLTYEPTGERVTIYAADRRSIDLLITAPGLVETLRQAWTAGADRVDDIDGDLAAIRKETDAKGGEHG